MDQSRLHSVVSTVIKTSLPGEKADWWWQNPGKVECLLTAINTLFMKYIQDRKTQTSSFQFIRDWLWGVTENMWFSMWITIQTTLHNNKVCVNCKKMVDMFWYSWFTDWRCQALIQPGDCFKRSITVFPPWIIVFIVVQCATGDVIIITLLSPSLPPRCGNW